MTSCPHPEKILHASADAARKHLTKVNRRFEKAGEHVYHCGDHWHIGSDRKSFEKAIRQALRRGGGQRGRGRRNRRS